jgi:hypothetical protein
MKYAVLNIQAGLQNIRVKIKTQLEKLQFVPLTTYIVHLSYVFRTGTTYASGIF